MHFSRSAHTVTQYLRDDDEIVSKRNDLAIILYEIRITRSIARPAVAYDTLPFAFVQEVKQTTYSTERKGRRTKTSTRHQIASFFGNASSVADSAWKSMNMKEKTIFEGAHTRQFTNTATKTLIIIMRTRIKTVRWNITTKSNKKNYKKKRTKREMRCSTGKRWNGARGEAIRAKPVL